MKQLHKGIKNTVVGAITSALLSVSSMAIAEPLWSNKAAGGDDYLLGTIHLGDASLATLPQSIKDAIDSVDKVILEVDIATVSPQQQQELLLKYALLPEGKTLSQMLSTPVYKEAEQYFTDAGMNIQQFAPFKPWMVALTMVQISYAKLGLDGQNGVDKQIEAYAREKGKVVEGLETFGQQLNFFNEIMDENPELTSDDLILDTIKEIKDYADLPNSMISAWHKGDMQVFEKIYKETLGTSKFDKAAEKVLLVDRNEKWVTQLTPILEKEKVLVAVGTLHFAGKSGLLKILPGTFNAAVKQK